MQTVPSTDVDRIRLFVYGLLLEGEREHELLKGSVLIGPARTKPEYTLVDLGVYPALLTGGAVSVLGELYVVSRAVRFELDVRRQCPVLFQRVRVKLDDDTEAETYAMSEEQVRGKRRLKLGDWRGRLSPQPRAPSRSQFVQNLRRR
jgi:gamma-glutamylaminecyclotransferase